MEDYSQHSTTPQSVMPTHSRRRKVRLAIYVVFGVLLLLQFTILAGRRVNDNLRSISVEAAAQVTDIKSQVANLPSPSTITAGQTSGNGASIITKYDDIVQRLRSEVVPSGNTSNWLSPWNYSEYSEARLKTVTTLTATANDIESLKYTLQTVLKFIEYNPTVDLATYSINDTTGGSSERLERTRLGVVAIIDALKSKNSAPYTSQIIVLLEQTLPSLEDIQQSGQISNWQETVRDSQGSIISALDNQFTSILATYTGALAETADTLQQVTD